MHTIDRVEVKTFLALCKELNTAFSHKCFILVHEGQFLDLLKLKINACDYLQSSDFRKDYACLKFLSKWKGWKFQGVDPRKTALDTWRSTEDRCYQTNRFFKGRDGLRMSGLAGIFHTASLKIASLLGPFSAFKVDECKWGPGATDVLKHGCYLDDKISGPISVTSRALDTLRSIIALDQHWVEALLERDPKKSFTLSRGGRLITVPKNALTDRVIVAEPTGNSFLQQGVGNYIRNRLKRVGIDLNDQGVNRRLASLCHVDGLSTIDLSSASDTISVELVKNLLPFEWFEYLNDIRSHQVKMPDGSYLTLQKFSSMGNGFTFELESLIFWAICSSASEDGFCSVFGDDIICRETDYDIIKSSLEVAGFVINEDKSFRSGSFFESCGGNFFDGDDVTPVYQKELASSPHELIRLYNRTVRWFKFEKHSRVTHYALKALRSYFHDGSLPRIPFYCTGDDGLVSNVDLLGSYDPNRGYCCRVWIFLPSMRRVHEKSLLAWKMRRPGYTSPSDDGRQLGPSGRGGRWVKARRYITDIS